MRGTSTHLMDIWARGGPFIGEEGAPHGRVTVEKDWYLNTTDSTVGSYKKGPVRWWQRADNSQVETEIPNIMTISIDSSLDGGDAAECRIELSNQWMNPNTIGEDEGELGNPGYFTYNRGESPESRSAWGHLPNEWNRVIVPDALIRTYQGYGGKELSIAGAVGAGYIMLTGVWLVDDVRINSRGRLEIVCRDMGKLLIEQECFPPLVPETQYPLRYCYWQYKEVPVGLGTAENPSEAVAIEPYRCSWEGYWVVADNGRVYALGDAQHLGDASSISLNQPMCDIAATPSCKGYYLCAKDGGIFTYGDAVFHGSLPEVYPEYAGDDIVGMALTPTGNGYWIAAATGEIYSFGDAAYFGSPLEAVGGSAGEHFSAYAGGAKITGIASHPTQQGYWCVADDGGVFSFGNVQYFGSRGASEETEARPITNIESTASGEGYWLVAEDGGVFTFGDGEFHGSMGEVTRTDITVVDMAPTPADDKGYILLDNKGGVHTYGSAVSYGSVSGGTALQRTPGNYKDYIEVVRDLLLWAGFFLYEELDSNQAPSVYGNIESTGAYLEDGCLEEDFFDKLPVIDPITKLKETVGYIFYIDGAGGVHFESPNWWAAGNFYSDGPNAGQHTTYIPECDERIQLTDYTVSTSDRAVYSEIFVSSKKPVKGRYDDTVTTRYRPPTGRILRGIVKNLGFGNETLTDPIEQRIMAELIAMHIFFNQRRGQVQIAANPALEINDQVRIIERQTSETYIHYIRGINSMMDLESGSYTMTLTTNWLGDAQDWAVTRDNIQTGEGHFQISDLLVEKYLSKVESRAVMVGRAMVDAGEF